MSRARCSWFRMQPVFGAWVSEAISPWKPFPVQVKGKGALCQPYQV